MMKFELIGYRHPEISETEVFPDPNDSGFWYPVYDAVYISEDLIFGRDD